LTDEVVYPFLTVKAVGHQWYWAYIYFLHYERGVIDYFNGVYTFIYYNSVLCPHDDLVRGEARLLEVGSRLVLPINQELNIQVTSADVLHCWAIPSLGVKIDAVPGRLNSFPLFILEAGSYFGMCSEICGVNHSFMRMVFTSFVSFYYILCDYNFLFFKCPLSFLKVVAFMVILLKKRKSLVEIFKMFYYVLGWAVFFIITLLILFFKFIGILLLVVQLITLKEDHFKVNINAKESFFRGCNSIIKCCFIFNLSLCMWSQKRIKICSYKFWLFYYSKNKNILLLERGGLILLISYRCRELILGDVLKGPSFKGGFGNLNIRYSSVFNKEVPVINLLRLINLDTFIASYKKCFREEFGVRVNIIRCKDLEGIMIDVKLGRFYFKPVR